MKNLFTKLIGAYSTLIILFLFSTVNVNGQYCTSSGTTPANDHITSVTFSGIENTSGATSYSDYTAMTAYVIPGVSYPITAIMANNNTRKETLTIYIDWNQDGTFNELDERYDIGECTSAECATTGISGMIEVPHTALQGTTRMRVIGKFSTPPTSACGVIATGEVEDYTVSVAEGGCAPNFDYVITNDCENETYSVAAILNDFGDNDFVSVAMTRSDGVQVFPVTVSSELPQGYVFQLIEDVPTGISVTAVIQSVNTACNVNKTWLSLGCFCIPEYTSSGCNFNYVISNVSLAGENVDLDNTTVCSGPSAYAYYAALPQPDLAPGEPYTLNVSTGYTSPNFVQAMAWIDFNKDSEFTADERIGNTNGAGFGSGTVAFNFTVPEDVVPGENYRLRVRLVYGSAIPTWDACNSQPNGETEDYKITFLQLPDCEGTPSAGVIEADDNMYCPNSPILLTSVGASAPASGQVRVWQTSPIGADTWTDIPGASPSTYTYTSMDTPSDIRYKVTCTLSGQSDVSNVITINLNPVNECYCTPGGTNASYYVSNFTTTGGIENITNVGSGFSTGGYGDFTAMSVKQVKTESINFTFVGGGAGSTYGFRIWVDWNQDGQFSATEEVAYSSTTYANTHTGSITVPESAATGITRMRIVSHWLSTTGDIAPCATGHTYGEFEDYSFNVIPLDACTGIPEAGVAEDDFGVCAFTGFTLNVTGASDAAEGLLRIWQSSPAGENDWTDIENGTSPDYTHTEGVGVATDFRFKAYCEYSNETDYSNVVQVTMSPGTDCYCVPVGAGNNGDEIRNFTLANLNHSTPASEGLDGLGYSNYSDIVAPAVLIPGVPYIASITGGTGSGNHGAAIWIDYNDNGAFELSEKVAYIGSSIAANATASFPAFIPPNVPGLHRLRVQYVYNKSGDVLLPCTTTTGFTETEDYMVEVTSLDPCEGSPSAGVASVTGPDVCANTPILLETVGASDMAGGMTRLWQSSPAGQDDWTDIPDSYSTSYTYQDGIDEPTDFRFRVECEFSAETDISNMVSLGLITASECYCTPVTTNPLRYINNFTTTNGFENISNTNTGYSPGGFGDFTDMILEQEANGTINFSVDIVGSSAGFRIWVDWNQDGQFDTTNEVVYNSTAYSLSHSGSFTVPANALEGTTRMRIGSNSVNNTGLIDPCTTDHAYGEFEDYTFEVVVLDNCEGSPTAGVVDATAFNVCANTPVDLHTTGASDPAEGLTRVWQSSPAGQDDWTDIPNSYATSYTYNPGISQPTDFRYKVECSFSEESDISNIVTVGLNPATDCYCEPQTGSTYYVNAFSTAGGIENVNNTLTSAPAGGYGDFTAQVVEQEHNASVTFSATMNTSTHGMKIWVDWNQDGQFSASEVVYQSSGYSGTFSGSFTVPGSAVEGLTRMRVGTHFVGSTGPDGPCEISTTSIAYQDYGFNVITLVDCTEAIAGTVVGDTEMEFCAGTPFDLSVEGNSGAADGLTREWQSSPAGENNWTGLGTGSSTIHINGISSATDYRYFVECSNGDSDSTGVVSVTTNPDPTECYCEPHTNSTYYVSSFSTTGGIDNINNTVSPAPIGGYADFTDQMAAQENTETINFSATMSSSTHGMKIWIDWNQDGNFSAAEIVYQSSSYSGTFTGSFTVPETALEGITRMRVGTHLVSSTGPAGPCETTSTSIAYQDYSFNVIPLLDCTEAIAGTIVEGADMEVCSEAPFNLSVEGNSGAAEGLTRTWQSSPAGEDDWTDLNDGSSTLYVDGIDAATDYRYHVECDNGDSDTSGIISVSLNPNPAECYCIPGGTSASYYINNFSTTGGVKNIQNLNSGYSPNGYGDFTASDTVSQVVTESITFNATYSGGTFGTKIWVDWDQNGIFETDEIAFVTSSYASTQTGSFTIPESALSGATRMRVGISYTPQTGPNDPCETGSREFEDYTLVVIPLDGCTGTPTAGVAADIDDMCAFDDFTLTVTGASDAADELIRIWQSSPAGQNDWTDIEGSNSTSYNHSGVVEPTDFRFRATCNNSGETDYSNVVEVSLNPGVDCYCIPTYSSGCTFDDDISNVTLNGETISINNSTTCSASSYSDYTASQPKPDLAPGEMYTISISTSYSTPTSEQVMVWIDYNENGFFEPSERIVNTNGAGLPGGSASFEFLVPDDVPAGDYRLRVRLVYGSAIPTWDACISQSFGETEDYMIEIITLDACSGTPSAGVVDATGYNVCALLPISLETVGASEAAGGLTRGWQSSPAGQDDWTDIENAFSATYTLSGGISEPTDFRYRVECSFSEEEDISDVLSIGLKPSNVCYCEPQTNSTYYVNAFSTTGGIENINNTLISAPVGGYGDFTAQVVSQEHTESVTFSATMNTSTHGMKVWVDWNQDGAFSASEIVYQSSSYSGTFTGTFTVPLSALEGITRMRVGTHITNSSGPAGPCETSTTSIAYQDYGFNVITLVQCTEAIAGTVVGDTELEFCSGTPFNLSVEGNSGAAEGLTREWQSSPAGEDDWTSMGTGSSTIHINGITTPTDYRYFVACDNGDSDTSEIITATINPDPTDCYCEPHSGSTYYVSSFSTTGAIENINNTVSPAPVGGYADFTDQTASQEHTGSVNFSATMNTSTHGMKIWIDWNQDGEFNATEIVYQSSSYSGTFSGSFTVPQTALEGTTRMRVGTHLVNSSGPAGPCETTSTSIAYQDYSFDVITLVPCTEANAGTVVGDAEMEVCPNSPFSLTVTGQSGAAEGLIRTWQSSPAGEDNWTDLNVGSSTLVVTVGISDPTDYRYFVDCENGDSNNSNVVSLSINPNPEECYCIPEGTNSARYISSFSTTGGTENITNNSSGFSPGGYGDFTSMEVTQTWEGTVNFTVSIQGGTAGFRIWVDWNQDGQFDTTTEVVYNSTSYSASHSGSFTVPEGVALGATRMRIVSNWSLSNGLVDPCATGYGNGEFEDYTFNVSEPVWDCPEWNANIGMPCNDGDPETANDVLDANCNCAGIIPPAGTFCESAITVECNAPVASYNSASSIATNTTSCTMGAKGLWFKFEGTGLDITVNATASFNHEMSINSGTCDDLTSLACIDQGVTAETYTITESVEGLMYYVYVANWSSTANTTGVIGISIVCEEAQFDCPELEANIGDACDDGDANTENDVITDACECAGTPIYECPELEANIGDACDDGDANTENDMITEACECVGTSIYDCPELGANIGDTCNDGNPLTENDVVTEDCECAGTLIEFDCPDLNVNFGDACDDGNDHTENDMYNTDCECVGTAIIYDCPDLFANIGDACSDDTIENGVVNDDCECAPWVSAPTVDSFSFTMYPNPAGSNESVTLTSNQSIDRYEILDITGKLIDAQIILNQNEIVIALRNYSAGMYILKAYSGSNFSTQKMVVR